jgi:hypothetical protein
MRHAGRIAIHSDELALKEVEEERQSSSTDEKNNNAEHVRRHRKAVADVRSRVLYTSQSLSLCCEETQNDPEYAMTLIRNDAHAFQFLPIRLRHNRRFSLAVLAVSGQALQHMYTTGFAYDRECCLVAVTQDGMALKHASRNSEDLELVTNAVLQNGLALQYAHRYAKENRDIVKVALQSSQGQGLKFAYHMLKEDLEIVQVAVSYAPSALRLVGFNLKRNEFNRCVISSLALQTALCTNDKAGLELAVSQGGTYAYAEYRGLCKAAENEYTMIIQRLNELTPLDRHALHITADAAKLKGHSELGSILYKMVGDSKEAGNKKSDIESRLLHHDFNVEEVVGASLKTLQDKIKVATASRNEAEDAPDDEEDVFGDGGGGGRIDSKVAPDNLFERPDPFAAEIHIAARSSDNRMKKAESDYEVLRQFRGRNPLPGQAGDDQGPRLQVVRDTNTNALGHWRMKDHDNHSSLSFFKNRMVRLNSLPILSLASALGMSFSTTDDSGQTPAHYAAQHDCPEAIRMIGGTGANVNVADELDQDTPLHLAASEGHIDVITELLKKKISLEEEDAKGRTALLRAVWTGKTNCCMALLEAGANLKATDELGQNAAHLAVANGHFVTLDQLFKFSSGTGVKNFLCHGRDSANRTPLQAAQALHHEGTVTKLVLDKVFNHHGMASSLSDPTTPPKKKRELPKPELGRRKVNKNKEYLSGKLLPSGRYSVTDGMADIAKILR